MSIALEEFRRELNIGVYGKGHDDVERLLMVIKGGTELPHPRLMYDAPPCYGLRSEILTASQVANIPWIKNSEQATKQYGRSNSDIVARSTKLAARLRGTLHMSVKDIYLWLVRNADDVLSASKPREWLNTQGTERWIRCYDDEYADDEDGDSIDPHLAFLVPTDNTDDNDVPIYMWYTIHESAIAGYMPSLTNGSELIEYYYEGVENMSKQQLTSALLALLKDNQEAVSKLLNSEEWKDNQP